MEFIIGQRWVSQAEPQLGLGIVVEADARHVTIHYPAIEEDRIYASNNAPLARIEFQTGDSLLDAEQNTLQVKGVESMNGLNYYLVEAEDGKEIILPEPKLAATIQLSSPTERLFSGQFDKNRHFQLRAAALHYRHSIQQSPVRGLVGPRTNLLPHQIYIASTVASRYAPRVLLADEVGLGKTIEAGLILHQQIQTGLVSRALIVVPEPLLHQWLIEMLRKFNLRFSLFDRTRYQALIESGESNPFETEQTILCSMELLCSDESIADHARNASWDLLIVDEAHHLEWSPDPEIPSGKSYQVVESLADTCNGLLLLTATPEQIGVESHFARLRLLDPAKFNQLQEFIDEQSHYRTLNDIVTTLYNEQQLNPQQQQELDRLLQSESFTNENTLPDKLSISELHKNEKARKTVIKNLLDRHGTGRVLFRNTRAAIKDFPSRNPTGYALTAPEGYRHYSLQPEQHNDDWLQKDPRVTWLIGLLKELRKEKLLLICASAKTAVDLEHHLHLNIGVRSTAFHEGLSILERDRAAAYFSDTEAGAQVMICSEIGSEGRNFQFAHHLALFDLPTNPDLLEQRIGRLDRIGQTEDIKIHIPYLENSAQAYLFRWYHEGLNAFGTSFSAGLAVYNKFSAKLQHWLDAENLENMANQPNGEQAFEKLIEDTANYRNALQKELEHGRDHLLEINSCDDAVAANLIDGILESERSETLADFMTLVFDNYGVDQEYHSENSLVVRPSDQMLTADFPHLKDEGLTLTYSREKAQSREDMEFMTWEHPMVNDCIELIIGSELGNACIGAVKLKSLPAGTVLIECFFSVQCPAPRSLQVDRFLPATPIRVLLESSGKDLTTIIKHNQLNQLRQHLKRSSRFAIVKEIKTQLTEMIHRAQQIATERTNPLIDNAKQQLKETLGEEITRLKQLQALNGSVRNSEIDFFNHQLSEAERRIHQATAEMQAIRLIINT